MFYAEQRVLKQVGATQQLHVAAGCRGVDGHRLFCTKAVQVVRATGFGAGTAEAFSTERLYTDDSANHVAIDVNVANVRTRSECHGA